MITIVYSNASPMQQFAVAKLQESIRLSGEEAEAIGYEEWQTSGKKAQIIITVVEQEQAAPLAGGNSRLAMTIDAAVLPDGFEIRRAEGVTYVLAVNEAGAMYGVLELAERLELSGEFEKVAEEVINARFSFRAVKFNLPWSSYRKNDCFRLQTDTVRDLSFWAKFLDMMAVNRYNVLTFWNLHPFTSMIRPVNFPLACPLTDEELQEWRHYWTTLFRMAKERGIATYMIGWNIFVSEAFREHYDPKAISDETFYHYGDSYSTEQIKQYTRECVTQLINEYPDLTGIGTSLGERMNDMMPEERQSWINDVYFEGMRQADRRIKFIHRAPFSVDPSVTRQAIEAISAAAEEVWLEVKFNWSHAYSSEKLLLTHGGSNGMEGYWNPEPTHYGITWMIRNEDFFTLRWAQPAFIRKHIAENGQSYVGGYYIGSECMIPALDYSHKQDSEHKNWDYLFEKNWLYYMLWGRILYHPGVADKVFEHALNKRHRSAIGKSLLAAYSSVCKMPMALASLYSFTWDFTLYAEGFMSTDEAEFDEGASFISLQDLLERGSFNPEYVSVANFTANQLAGVHSSGITPLELASTLEKDASAGLDLLAGMPSGTPELCCEKADIEAWAFLNLYFAAKLRAATAYSIYRHNGDEEQFQIALKYIQAPYAAAYWERIVDITESHYTAHPLMHLGKTLFSWRLYLPFVQADIKHILERQ
ncbi:hypothetical protein [Paenibacillus sp. GXUN7292]|uniref:hypothetical protein n=1 Tax=Paenibacillus sp. GXUN7292 TaxID=3422499 RepID=UPI003D7EDA78